MKNINIIIGLLLTLTLINCSDEDNPLESGDDKNALWSRDDNDNFTVLNGDVTIAGTLDLPSTQGPHPVIIIVPGSGKTTREAASIATEIFVPQGIAVLRYDKRGVGESTGVFEGPGAETSIRIFDDLASDVLALIGFLKSQADINSEQIGLSGASQGGWIAPLVASQSNDVAFIICTSGATNTVGVSDYYDFLADDSSLSIDEIIEMLPDFTGVHGFDPLPSLKALTIPGLWIYGGQDRSNPTKADIAILETLIADLGKDFTILLFPPSNHELIDVQTNELDPQLVPSLLNWVLMHVSIS